MSRVLGLVREMLQSRLIGAGVEQSAFTLAFAIPNMARKLFGEGALTAAFVPVFRGEVAEKGVADAAKLARAVGTMLLLMLGAAVVCGVVLLSVVLGLSGNSLSPRMVLTLRLVRVLIPYMLAICGAAFGMGVLNALGKFRASSFMPCLLNVFWILALAGLLFFPGLTPEGRILFVAGAILAGGFVQMAFMFRCTAKAGVRPLPLFAGWRSERVRLVWRNTAVAALGAGAVQINYMLDQVLAQCAAPWAAGVIGYAERLMDLPLGVVGVAFGTVLLPTFAGFFAMKDLSGAREALVGSVRNLLFVMVPAGVGLFLLAPLVTAVIYEGRAFDGLATMRVSRALGVYALGLGFFGVQKALIPWFQAQSDMKTPLRVSVCTVALNAVLNILAVVFLPEEWRHVGLAASTDVCAAAGCGLLVILAIRRNGPLGLRGLALPMAKIVAATAVMVAAMGLVRPFLAGCCDLLVLAALMLVGALAYLASSLLMKSRAKATALLGLASVIGFSSAEGAAKCVYEVAGDLHRPETRAHVGVPSIAVSPANGRMWATWYAGKSRGEDMYSYVTLATSSDGGRHWKEVLIADPDGDGPKRAFDPELWISPDGKLRWSWSERLCDPTKGDATKDYGLDEGDPKTDVVKMVTLSAEDEPQGIASAVDVGRGVMLGKPIVLKGGEWLLPLAHWNESPSACLYVSADNGRTFGYRGGATIPEEARLYDEHQLVECENGDVVAFIRTNWGKRFHPLMTVSKDGGRTWDAAKPATYRNTSARVFVRRLKSGCWLLVKNGPVDKDVGRKELTAFLSGDEGRTWRGGLMLDSREAVSYPDGQQQSDGSVVVVYDRDRLGDKEILFAVFAEEDVLAGKDVSGKMRLRNVITSRNVLR